MAHGLVLVTDSYGQQRAPMFSVQETPWHGLGIICKDAPTIAEGIKMAGLDWKTELHPLVTAGGLKTDSFATVNSKSSEVLGVVGSKYQPLHNENAFQWFQPLIDSGDVKLETAGSLHGGKKVWIMGKIGSETVIKGNDTVEKYILLSNSHDGSSSIRVGFTPVRVVCQNTLAASHASSESKLIRVRHTISADRNLAQLRGIMNLANATFEASVEKYRELASRQINRKDLEMYVKVVMGQGNVADEDISTRARNQIDEVLRCFEQGKGQQMKETKHTWWTAYNAVTEYLSYSASANDNARYDSLWFGANKSKSESALDLALFMSKAA